MLSKFRMQRLSKFKQMQPWNSRWLGTLQKAETQEKEVIEKSPRGKDRTGYTVKVGDQVHGFKLTAIDHIRDFNIVAYSLEHQKTGAKYLHLDTEDMENVFTVRFKTFPTDSTGVPHILEHMSLCGSKNYPVRDPFMNMLKRSLNTYMNAWTGNDFTMYPFATCNEKDYKNLLSVYLDATFFPLLKKHDFMQEGYRYEFEEAEDPKSNLTIKGVVFNEMKGVMSNAEHLYLYKIYQHLFEKACYKYNSGGDPTVIPTLKHEDLVEFHSRFYHPSNSMFITYGDLDFTKHIEFIEDKVLKHFDKKELNFVVDLESRLKEPKVKTEYFMPDLINDPESQGKFSYNFLCNDVTKDQYENFCLYILSGLFFDGPSTPFYKNLIESGLAPAYSPGSGYDMTSREALFGIGVSNINPSKENIEQIEKTIEDTLQQVVKEGFPEDQFESQLHKLEIQVKKTREQWGLGVISNMISYTIHGGDPLWVFNLNENLDRIRKDYKKGIFEELIKKYLINNKHKLILKFLPDETLSEKDKIIEQGLLKQLQGSLTEEGKNSIVKESIELKKYQEQVQNPDVLPTLSISDIPTSIEFVEHKKSNLGEIPVYWFEQPTNGLTHLRIKCNIAHIPENLRVLIPAFCEFISEIGTKNYNYADFHTLIHSTTSGVDVQNDSFSLSANYEDFSNNIIVSVAFLDRNIDKAMTYLSELLSTPNFDDHAHLSDLIKTSSVEIANEIGKNSLQYGFSFASSGLKNYAKRGEKLSSDIFICELGAKVTTTSDPKPIFNDLIFNLTDLAANIFREENMSIAVTGHKSKFKLVEFKLEMILNAITKENSLARLKLNDKAALSKDKFEQRFFKNYFETPLTVNNCVESFLGPGYYDDNYGTALVAANLLTHEFLIPSIREKGGAYGAGAKADENGIFNFYSFWDPKLNETYDNFEYSIQKLCNKEFSEKQLEYAKLSTFQKLDKVIEPSLKGMLQFARGYTDTQRSNHRLKALSCSIDDISNLTENILMKQLESGKSARVVFGPKSSTNEELKSAGWAIEKPLEFLSSSYFDKF